ncbi:hypothetical protein CHCC20333_2875 [Bacillus paralicheniformis]|nr:hypothetical protein CHCC20333_2875 [Bacillus paralicheniformis]
MHKDSKKGADDRSLFSCPSGFFYAMSHQEQLWLHQDIRNGASAVFTSYDSLISDAYVSSLSAILLTPL